MLGGRDMTLSLVQSFYQLQVVQSIDFNRAYKMLHHTSPLNTHWITSVSLICFPYSNKQTLESPRSPNKWPVAVMWMMTIFPKKQEVGAVKGHTKCLTYQQTVHWFLSTMRRIFSLPQPNTFNIFHASVKPLAEIYCLYFIFLQFQNNCEVDV